MPGRPGASYRRQHIAGTYASLHPASKNPRAFQGHSRASKAFCTFALGFFRPASLCRGRGSDSTAALIGGTGAGRLGEALFADRPAFTCF